MIIISLAPVLTEELCVVLCRHMAETVPKEFLDNVRNALKGNILSLREIALLLDIDASASYSEALSPEYLLLLSALTSLRSFPTRNEPTVDIAPPRDAEGDYKYYLTEDEEEHERGGRLSKPHPPAASVLRIYKEHINIDFRQNTDAREPGTRKRRS